MGVRPASTLTDALVARYKLDPKKDVFLLDGVPKDQLDQAIQDLETWLDSPNPKNRQRKIIALWEGHGWYDDDVEEEQGEFADGFTEDLVENRFLFVVADDGAVEEDGQGMAGIAGFNNELHVIKDTVLHVLLNGQVDERLGIARRYF